MENQNIRVIAIAGGAQDNCLFNCIAHSLFSLNEDKLAQVAKRPVFNELITAFLNYYGLDENTALDLDDLLAIHECFDSPYDIEAIWGPVLRVIARNLPDLDPLDKDDISLGRAVSDTVATKLSNALGASCVVHCDWGEINSPLEDEIFQITLHHSQAGGGHYDFCYPDDPNGARAIQHNNSYEIRKIVTNCEGAEIEEEMRCPIFSSIYNECKEISDKELRRDIIGGLLSDFMVRQIGSKKTFTILGKRTREAYQEANDESDDVNEPAAKKSWCILS